MNELILYTTDDGRSQITLRSKGQTVWLTQQDMAHLFDVSTDNVGLHLKKICEDWKLSRLATTEESSVAQSEYGVDAAAQALHNQGFKVEAYKYLLNPLYEEATRRRARARSAGRR